MDKKRKVWKTVDGAKSEVATGTARFVRLLLLKLRRQRTRRSTIVKEIHIIPEEDNRWASRSDSSSSRTSTSTNDNICTPNNETACVVHDMKDEYDPEYR